MCLPSRKTCLFRDSKETVLGRVGPTGSRNGTYGVWQERRCVYCGSTTARWKSGITAATRLEALDQNRPATSEEQQRWLIRDSRLGLIEQQNRPQTN